MPIDRSKLVTKVGALLEGVHDELVLVGQRRHRVGAEIQADAASVPAVKAGEQTWKLESVQVPFHTTEKSKLGVRDPQIIGLTIWTVLSDLRQ